MDGFMDHVAVKRKGSHAAPGSGSNKMMDCWKLLSGKGWL